MGRIKKLIFWAYCALGLALIALAAVHSNMPESIPEPEPSAAEPTAYVTEKRVPILVYHNVADEGADAMTITPEGLERQLRFLADGGFTAVSLDELTAFVNGGAGLPERLVCITFDDGYYSNYEFAFPLLKKYNMKATIFSIGVNSGRKEFYKDTNYPIIPSLGTEEMREMLASGLVSFQSHTYDMHQRASYETGDAVRETIMPLENETVEAYTRALWRDFQKERELLGRAGVERISAVAFPKGVSSPLANELLSGWGVQVTLTTNKNKVNVIVRGDKASLLDLGRLTMSDAVTNERLGEYLAINNG